MRKTIRLFFYWVCLLAGMVSVQAGTVTSRSRMLYVEFYPDQTKNREAMAGRYRVPLSELPLRFAKSDDEAMLESYVSPLALKGNPALDDVFILYVKDGWAVEEVVERLQSDPMVKNVEVAPEYRLLSLPHSAKGRETGSLWECAQNTVSLDGKVANKEPDDPYYGIELGLNLKWHLDLINAEEAWKLQTASPEVTVAVVDNAVWGEHPDLQIPKENQYNTGSGEQTSSPLDLGLDLNQDEVCTQSDLDNSACETYNWSHGTHVAGLLAALNGNGEGVASLGSGVNVLAVANPSISSPFMQGNPYEGIRWAVDHGAQIVNCSWTATTVSSYEKELVSAWVEEGVIIVAGVANNALYDELNYPAALPGVISVGACNYDKSRARLSNYGGWVDVMAPGGEGPSSVEKVFSTMFGQSQVLPNAGYDSFEGQYYDYMEGASMATPLVSALCALVLSKDSTVSPLEMEELLRNTAQKGDGLGIGDGSGIIDAAAALKAVESRVRRVEADYVLSFSGVCESGMAKVYWEVDAEAAHKPDFLRFYKNGILCMDNLSYEGGSYKDSSADMMMNHRYEICGVKDGVESFRKQVFVSIGNYYELQAVAQPAEGGRIYGTGRYEPSSMARLIAEPNPGYRFARWTYHDLWEGDDYLRPQLTLDMTQEYLGIVAHFEKVDASIEEACDAESFRLWPNPVADWLVWELPFAGDWEMRLFDLSGRQLAAFAAASLSSYDVSALSPGVYLLQAYSRDGMCLTRKFVKK